MEYALVDTGVSYAMFDRHDPYHSEAKEKAEVLDLFQLVLPWSVSLMDSADQAVRTRETDESGELLWTDLPLGEAVFVVRPSGGQTKRITIAIRSAKELKAEVHIFTPVTGMIVISKHKHNGWLIY